MEAAGLCIGQTVWLKSDQHTHLKEQRDSRPPMVQTGASQEQQMERPLDQARAASSAKASDGPLTSLPSSLEAGRTTRPKIRAWRWQVQASKQFKAELKGSDMALTGKEWVDQLGFPNRNNQV